MWGTFLFVWSPDWEKWFHLKQRPTQTLTGHLHCAFSFYLKLQQIWMEKFLTKSRTLTSMLSTFVNSGELAVSCTSQKASVQNSVNAGRERWLFLQLLHAATQDHIKFSFKWQQDAACGPVSCIFALGSHDFMMVKQTNKKDRKWALNLAF